MKRALLLVDDELSSSFYRDALAAAGFEVAVANNLQTAAQAVAKKAPEIVVADLFTEAPPTAESVQQLRQTRGLKNVPLLILPNLPAPLAKSAVKAGAHKVLPAGANLRAAVMDEALGALGIPSFTPEDHRDGKAWHERVLGQARDAVTALRLGVRDFASAARNPTAFYATVRQAHFLATRAMLARLKGLWQFASAVEAFMFDLFRMPEQANPSTLRTLTEAIDMMAMLFTAENAGRISEPSHMLVLAVDDDPQTGEAVTTALERCALPTIWVETAQKAIEKVNNNRFDIIFLDIALADGSGFDVCKEIRQLPQYERTPIVFITAMATFQNRVQSSLSGGNDFIGKPFNLHELPVKAMVWVFKGQLGQL